MTKEADVLDALKSLDKRLRECMKDDITAAEAYDSFYQEIVADALASIPSASAAQWISVRVRQPEKEGTYFTLKKGDALCEASTAPWHKGEWIWSDGTVIRMIDPDMAVEYWMPIPEVK